jgi:hypothetical protein
MRGSSFSTLFIRGDKPLTQVHLCPLAELPSPARGEGTTISSAFFPMHGLLPQGTTRTRLRK